MQLVSKNININFLGKRKFAFMLTGFLLLATIGLLFGKGLNYGIDFIGGAVVQIKTEQPADIGSIRNSLAQAGFKGVSIQEYGAVDEFLIRVPATIMEEGDLIKTIGTNMVEILTPVIGKLEVRRVEFVGPQVGQELRKKGLIAILASLIAILIYISIRFEFRYALGAIVALAHDVFLTIGVFSLMQKEISLPVLAALLTIIGYSLNDTIVVFDRVRENRRKYRKKPLETVLNISVNDMLNRTLMTSLTTLVVLCALYFYGGEVINDFAFTLMFGVIVGTYSSVFVASPVVLWLESYYKKLDAALED